MFLLMAMAVEIYAGNFFRLIEAKLKTTFVMFVADIISKMLVTNT